MGRCHESGLGVSEALCGRVAVGVTIKFTAAILELVLPLLLATVIDDLVPARDLTAIWRTGVLMGVLAFGAAGCNITANRMAAWVSMEVTRELRRDLYRRVQELSCAQMDRFSASSMVSRLTNDTYNVHQMFDKVQRGGIRAPMLVLGGLVLTFLQEPVFGPGAAGGKPSDVPDHRSGDSQGHPLLYPGPAGGGHGGAHPEGERLRCPGDQSPGLPGPGAGTVETANHASRRAEETGGWVMALTNPITDFLLNTGLTAVVLVGALRVDAGLMQRGQIVAFLTYFTLIQSATLGIAKVFVRVSKGAASARRIQEILQAPMEQTVQEPEGEEHTSLLGMEGATFSYLGGGAGPGSGQLYTEQR